MSEADLPTPDSFDQPPEAPLSEPLPPSEESVSPAATLDEEWETVNFPNTIPLEELLTEFINQLEQSAETEARDEDSAVPDGIFLEGSEGNEMATASLMSVEGETEDNPVRVVQILHQCNQDLINRVAELEAELDENRQNRQNQDTELLQRTQELGATQDQVKRLFKKLEIANQVIRQQQVLVETLTQQWESTQTRLAQMERDCALTQQRYNEQFHELVQAQNMGRELRSRLHRQQRQALQFKVALERCLENQAQFETGKQTLESIPVITEEPHLFYSAGLLTPKAPPVQPWSASNNNPIHPMKDSVNSSTDSGNIGAQTSLEFEMTLPVVQALSEGLESLSSEETPLSNPEPFKPPVELTVSNDEIPVEESPQPRFLEGELERIRLEYASFISEDADLFVLQTPSETMPMQQQFARSTGEQSFNLEVKKSQSTSAVAVQQRESEESKTANWPAPLIYPQRRKKLESLASIHLPTFPKENPFLTEDF
ncbi:hypothetical protein [Planktothrix pseudagardhii]|uniref:Uncharacterized protein n=1 Tax=Planktothrix pseudagardhii TaxID=132604 RepID=A0A9W4G8Q5_9CYAN|nr:hypothetical protein [Planktothrix pseudagardhii]CAD5964186.1 hypothetical protein NO713_03393 [Planktothrix pseudagardhii]